ncbi:phophatase 2c family protein [Lentinula edodes]|uniref:Phophatase 2c family protein n=1 Tax=Lentinula edodes TaxID=5353 RepID=A0A1Q3EPS5_LENED|nr:phophatase 2c family protein [Lentinula edodes]
MRGTTVLVVLINSDGGLWTASLGDCQAVLGQKESSFWTTTILREEESAVAKNRVLGLIAVTRAIGDHQFKLPSIYTKRVFSLTIPGMNRPDHTQIIVKRNLTPPYVSGIPEVKYVKLHDGARACLFMCSDGLLDLYGGENWQEKHIDIAELCKTWVDLVGEKLDSSSQSFDPKENLALFLLNRGLRGPPRSYTGEIWTSGWMTRPFWWKSCNRCPDIVIVEYVSPLYVFPVLSLCRLVLRSRLLAGGVSVVARAHHCHSLSQPFQLYTPLRSSLIFRILFMASNNTSTETVDLGKVVFGVTEPTFIMEMFVLLFYGIYTMLFGLYVYLQIHQRGQQRYYQISLLLLYLLATMAVVVSILIEKQMTLFTLDLTFTDDLSDPLVASHFISYANLTVAAEGIYVAANIIADALLLYRCYVVWGSKKYVIAGPIVISLVNTVIAIVSAALIKNNAGRLLNTAGVENTSLQAADIISYAFLSVNLFTNLMLTGLIAGRIWWIARDTRRSLGIDNSSDKSIGGIAAMVLESGLLYPVALVVGLALTVPGTVDVQAILTLIVGIAPTLIMVRTDLGISIENASNTDPNETEKAYKNFPEFERPAHGYNWTADMKGKAPERDVPETEERSNEITSLSPSDPVRDIDAPPPAFSESQYEGTSTLISSGPPAHRNEKQPQGLIVLNPPTMDE